ncbi:hypothetical protein Hamer_G017789 [Homarus americanus]|uniref:THAP-type domain-containing protein n=1 Tax=Homarus americanus TaxID=6706 RepID=A0A8J5N7J0_HOMAM|nr:hypothetical protein Hamer_G017789 [Homarus americanus]
MGPKFKGPGVLHGPCLQWLSAVNQPILHKKTYEQLNRSCNICSFHFSPKNYINGTPHSRLTKLACPDQNLTDNARDSSSIAANCSYESAFDGSTQGSGNIEKEISVDYTTDVRPRDLQYDFDDLDLASTVEFDVILTRESWDPAFPDPALSGKEVVTRQSELGKKQLNMAILLGPYHHHHLSHQAKVKLTELSHCALLSLLQLFQLMNGLLGIQNVVGFA